MMLLLLTTAAVLPCLAVAHARRREVTNTRIAVRAAQEKEETQKSLAYLLAYVESANIRQR